MAHRQITLDTEAAQQLMLYTLWLLKAFSRPRTIKHQDLNENDALCEIEMNGYTDLVVYANRIDFGIPNMADDSSLFIEWQRNTNIFKTSSDLNDSLSFALSDDHPLLRAFRRIEQTLCALPKDASEFPAIFSPATQEAVLSIFMQDD